MDSVSPVLTEREVSSEQVVALGQSEYYPIIVVRLVFETFAEDGSMALTVGSLVRFRFTDKERALIAAGADLLIGQPHHGPMMPVSLELAMPGEYPAR